MSLRAVYSVAMTIVFLVSTIAFSLFDLKVQRDAAEEALVEEARMFAREMDAVWQFMDNSQDTINTAADGSYDFKGLHCSIVGKSIGSIFSARNDYAIRYTNFNPRSPLDEPDEFEAAALSRFNEDRSVREFWAAQEYEGKLRFRYAQALRVDESCLECHGSPAGEIDITGHAKEGWTLDSVGGAISIVIPVERQVESAGASIVRDVLFFVAIFLVMGSTIYAITSWFVLRPLSAMRDSFVEAATSRTLPSKVVDYGATSEMADVLDRFNVMAGELNEMYSNLEGRVSQRTAELTRANAELERQKDDLTRMGKRLAEESRFKTNLLSMVNHELRTPLTSIIALSQIALESEDGMTVSERSLWEEVGNSGSVLLALINDMLDVARSDAGEERVASELVDLGDVIVAVRKTLGSLATRAGLTLEVSIDPALPLVMGDYEKIRRTLENLGANAVKFTPEGGRVGLAARCVDGDVLLSISDTGIGVRPEERDRIFDRFYQGDSGIGRRHNGSGLGLTLVRQYADLMGYEVSLESPTEGGSVFSVRIPANLCVGGDYGSEDTVG